MRTIALIFFLTFFCGSIAHSKLISRVVGVAGKHYLTSREVQINTMLEHVMFESKVSNAVLSDSLNPENKEFANHVNAVLLEIIVNFEAEQFALSEIKSENILTTKKGIEKKLKGLKAWAEAKVASGELEKALRQKLMAKQFIRFKVDSSFVPVTDQEAEDYFRKNPKQFTNMDFKQKKEEIKTLMGRQRVDQRLQEWFGILQKKYGVRNFITTT